MHKRGFTLIEMVVAVALFAVVVIISSSALITLITANKKARTIKITMDNLNLVIDDMAQDLRLGSKYFCSEGLTPPIEIQGGLPESNVRDCPYQGETSLGGPYLSFRDRYGKIVFYRFVPGGCIQKKVTKASWSSGGYLDSPDIPDRDGVSYQCITSSDIKIEGLRFFVHNTSSGSDQQPYVLISVKGTAGAELRTQTTFSLMTSATQRIPHNVE